jgi:hypothetical protein
MLYSEFSTVILISMVVVLGRLLIKGLQILAMEKS